MTVNGVKALRGELEHLITKERPRIVQAIAEARAQGDLRENAEYQYAREEQGFIEGRIRKIEKKLSYVEVIDITLIPESNRVVFGTTVKLLNLNEDKQLTYQIVGDEESDIKLNKLSVNSPVARALIGKEVGDIALVKTPSGEVEYEICSVQHL